MTTTVTLDPIAAIATETARTGGALARVPEASRTVTGPGWVR